MKVLLLMIYSNNQEYYNKMLEIQRKYVHKYENVDVYFVRSSYEHNEEVFVDNDMIHVRSNEDYNTILYKTLYAMETLKNFYKKEYDFTVRSNISTIINIPKMIALLSLFQDKEYLYAGDIVGIERNIGRIDFALGTAIILSQKLANKMIDEMNNFNYTIEDDVSFGLFVRDHIPIAYDNSLKTGKNTLYTNTLGNGWNSTVNDFINFENITDMSNFIFYRNTTSNRHEDANIMNYIVDNILLNY